MGKVNDILVERQIMTIDLWPQVLHWRNDPDVYRWSRTNRPIDLVEHNEWFEKRQNRLNLEPIFSYFHRGDFVGMARLDLKSSDIYEVSLIVNPLHRGKGYGEKVLSDLCIFFLNEIQPGFRLVAVVHKHNEVSLRLFNKLGFRPLETQESLITLVYS